MYSQCDCCNDVCDICSSCVDHECDEPRLHRILADLMDRVSILEKTSCKCSSCAIMEKGEFV